MESREDQAAEPRTSAGGGRFLLAVTALLFAANAFRYRAYLIDDAYISLRYARNLVEGQGLVFNAGERVEGYTNFLWTLLGAAGLALGVDGMLLWKVISVISALAMLAVAGRLVSGKASGAVVPAAAWLLGLEAFGYWASTGMESTFYAALFAVATWLALDEAEQGRRRGSVWVFAALALTRPEGPLVFALVHGAAWLWLEATEPATRWRALRRHGLDGLAVAAIYGGHMLWRLGFYGRHFPNTYYAKITGGAEQWKNGFINLGQWAASQPVFALTLLAPLVLLPAWRHHRRLLALVSLSVGWAAYVVSVGGDFMPFFRFFLPLLPILAATASGLLDALVKRPRHRLAIAGGLIACQALAGFFDSQSFRAFVAHRTTVVGREVGRFFHQHLPEAAFMAVNTAGAVPYESRRPTLDMLGLTDQAIAHHPVYVVSSRWAGHRRGWGAYVRARRPRVILWYNAAGLEEPHYLGDHQLADDPFFRFFYQLKRQQLEAREPGRVLAYFAGAPFGRPSAAQGSLGSPDLGVSFEVAAAPLEHTLARDADIRLVYFELRDDSDRLWSLAVGLDDPHASVDLDPFLAAVRGTWRAESRPGEPAARRRVEDLCEQARLAVTRGETELAKRLLSRAAATNGDARSPLVYQYVANLATLEGDLFLAVQAQREALRLAPDNALYLRNLRSLLTTPYDDFKASRRSAEPPP